MGAKDSKRACLSYEDAVKRISDSELRRVCEAFKRLSGGGQLLSPAAFTQHVLGEGVPAPVSSWLYAACGGGPRGISLRDLVCGLVLLSKGTQDEKIRFLWTLYSNDAGTYISRGDFQRALQLEGGPLEGERRSRALTSLFSNANDRERVQQEQFRAWISHDLEATVLSAWLLVHPCVSLTSELDAPTFYQTLAGVTHLEETDICELEKCFWVLQASGASGQLDLPCLEQLVSPPVPREVCQGLFRALDVNDDGHVDFKELCCGISAACRGPTAERLKFCFKMFDLDRDGELCRSELLSMLSALDSPGPSPPCPLLQEDFLLWALDGGAAVAPLLELLFEVCHVALGLRPRCRHQERAIALGWLAREQRRGYRVGQFWYLAGAAWWRQWEAYTAAPASLGERCGCDAGPGVAPPAPPGPVDNSGLVSEPAAGARVPSLTGEGGSLRRDAPLVQHRDFELVPDALWKALQHWYGGPLPLPRQVIRGGGGGGGGGGEVDLELYPLNLRVLRHVARGDGGGTGTGGAWGAVVGGYGAAALGTAAGLGAGAVAAAQPRRQLTHTAAFSRLATVRQVAEFLAGRLSLRAEDVRLWLCPQDAAATLLEDEMATLQETRVQDGDQVLLEVRNKDLTWPEELGALLESGGVGGYRRGERRCERLAGPPAGATGLHNLGNTCFMNAALQAVSNTRPLTQYFRLDGGARWLSELNAGNPLGTRGQVARRYAELCRELWAGEARSVAPLRMRWCVARHAPHLGGGGQHDSQELLAWLLDALHEDLNRRAARERRPYEELRDSDGRPDEEVAREAWRCHLERDHSVVTELFYGQLKSKVACQTCGRESVRFDPFNLLSLPLPMEEGRTLVEAQLLRLDGRAPVRYAARLGAEARAGELRRRLAELSGVPASRLRLAEVSDSRLRRVPPDGARLGQAQSAGCDIIAYEIDGSDDEEGDGETPPLERDDAEELRCPEVSAASALCMPGLLCFKHMGGGGGKEVTVTSRAGSGARYIVAVHRKSVRQESYLLAQHKSRPALFGVPLLLRRPRRLSGRQLYELVCRQVARLLSAPPPAADNHAADCDDSLGYEFPFALRRVSSGGRTCARCPWTRFCRGCEIACDDEPLAATRDEWVAIDWDPTALHLRYQSARERACAEDASVALCRRQHTEPIDLDHCLRAFTSEERLEARYHCAACQSKQPATKKLQIWRLPPILIVHLKRFDYVNGKWVKTQKVVDFPFDGFDPQAYLASVPQETLARHERLKLSGAETTSSSNGSRSRLESTSLERSPVMDEHLQDFHEHHLLPGEDPLELRYRLYAVVSHSGLLNGGHYIAYACNPNDSWYCYNDSSCREVGRGQGEPLGARPRIDTSSAYILFYERRGLDYAPYLPAAPPAGHPPPAAAPPDDDCDGDLRKQLCALS